MIPSEIQPYSTSSSLSRRQFLKGLLLFCGLPLLTFPGLANSRIEHAGAETLAWWTSLTDGQVYGPRGNIPHALPGSLMKLVATTALLEERLISPNDVFECRGTLILNGLPYHCQHPHGKIALREAIGFSCNLFFAQAGQSLSATRFLQAAEQFQLHQPATHAERFSFPNNPQGPCQSFVLGLNPELQPNAIQLLRMSGLIARRSIPDIRPATWDLLQAGMRLAATQGTASKLDPENRYRIAAKTGTAPYGKTYQSWLIGYFPFDKPKVAFCVRSQAGTAMDTAVPLARQFLRAQDWKLP
ncbi:MAG TPA: penicillin-binding transpeptidase domain-containing protein [Coleofasciculaceae cyanobacterium]